MNNNFFKIVFSFSIVFFLSCESEINTDVVSVSDFDLVTFEDDVVGFNLNQSETNTQTITVFTSRPTGSDRTFNLAVITDEAVQTPFDGQFTTTVDNSLYEVPESVVIPANETSATFDVTITDGGLSSEDSIVIAFTSEEQSQNPFPLVLDIQIVCPVNSLILDINFDDFAEETRWELYDLNGVSPVLLNSGGDNEAYDALDSESISVRLCIDSGDFGFVIYDAFGDGICCSFGEGSYTLTLNGEVIRSGGSFTNFELTEFTAP